MNRKRDFGLVRSSLVWLRGLYDGGRADLRAEDQEVEGSSCEAGELGGQPFG